MPAPSLLQTVLQNTQAKVATQIRNNVSPLMQAAFDRNVPVEVVKGLIERSNPRAQDRQGTTALMLAARQGSLDKVQALLPVSDAAMVNVKGENALMWAAGMGHAAVVTALLDQAPFLLNVQDNDGWSAMMHATMGKKPSTMMALVEAGIDTTLTTKEGHTLLMVSLRSENKPVASFVQSLLTLSDVNAVDHEGKTALYHGIENDLDASVVNVLLKGGADTTVLTTSGDSLLALAIRRNMPSAIDRFWSSVNLNHIDADGHSLLWHCVTNPNEDSPMLLQRLVDAVEPATVHATEKHGWQSIFHTAVQSPDPHLEGIVTCLLHAGVDWESTRDHDGLTPLDISLRQTSIPPALMQAWNATMVQSGRDVTNAEWLGLKMLLTTLATNENDNDEVVFNLMRHVPSISTETWRNLDAALVRERLANWPVWKDEHRWEQRLLVDHETQALTQIAQSTEPLLDQRPRL